MLVSYIIIDSNIEQVSGVCMFKKLITKTLMPILCISLSWSCIQMKPSNNEEGNSEKSSSSDSGSKKTFTNKTSDTSGLLNSKRTPSGRIALDFSNKRSIDVSNIVNEEHKLDAGH